MDSKNLQGLNRRFNSRGLYKEFCWLVFRGFLLVSVRHLYSLLLHQVTDDGNLDYRLKQETTTVWKKWYLLGPPQLSSWNNVIMVLFYWVSLIMIQSSVVKCWLELANTYETLSTCKNQINEVIYVLYKCSCLSVIKPLKTIEIFKTF